MRARQWLVRIAAILVGYATTAEAEESSCLHAEIVKVRGMAEQRVKAREYASAVELLQSLRAKCAIDSSKWVNDKKQVDLDFYWIHSDLSFALYRASRFLDCLSVLAPLTYPGPPDGLSSNDLDHHRVAKSIAYNEGLCEAALTKRYDKLEDKPCPDIARSSAKDRYSIALPKELSQGGRFRCLQIEGGAESDERKQALASNGEPDAKKLCPRIVAVGAKGDKKDRIALGVSEGTLSSVSNCCLVDKLSAGVVDGKQVVRLRGEGRDCFGGRAYFIADEVFEWRGNQLILVNDASRIAH